MYEIFLITIYLITNGQMERNIALASICCTVCCCQAVFKCSRCKLTYYCGKQHQKEHWASHKSTCTRTDSDTISTEKAVSQKHSEEPHKHTASSSRPDQLYILDQAKLKSLNELCLHIIISLQVFGFCVIDNILEEQLTDKILKECLSRYEEPGEFNAGQLVHEEQVYSGSEDGFIGVRSEDTRGDRVTWIKDNDQSVPNISKLRHHLDKLALLLSNSGKFPNCNIKSRTKPMIACFPGNDTSFQKHIDNPNKDGRRLTFIYYLNKDYQRERDEGVLRIYKSKMRTYDIEPQYGRLVIFWSDKTVHEVTPSKSPRFAISIWYFDAEERTNAVQKCLQLQQEQNKLTCAARNSLGINLETIPV